MAKKEAAETPLMKQHREIKERYPDAVLLFRVGDFYETFGEDAIIASRVLGITLTKRANGSSNPELAGFPHHSLDTYLHKLVKAGYRVAICDQLEDPKTVKGIVKRGVTELVTPGVATNDKLLENKTNNFLAALYLGEPLCGISFLDISTGEFFVSQGDVEYIDKLLQSFQPSEIILSKAQQKQFRVHFDNRFYTFALEDWIFQERFAYELLVGHFQTQSLKGFGIEELKAATIAAGATLHYLRDTEHPNLGHINAIQRIVADSFLWMDRFTIRNLELLNSSGDGQGTNLLRALDHTHTPMGARLLRRWMIFPLADIDQIKQRLDLTEQLIKDQELNHTLVHHIKQIGDVERLISKVPLKKASPREMLQLARGLLHMEQAREAAMQSGFAPLQQLLDAIQPCNELQRQIVDTISEEAPAVASKGNFIREGIHSGLDELRHISRSGKNYLLDIQQKEAQRTGIPSLKVAFNNVFGYYLEVTNAHKDKVPAEWIRKQTLANAERYITPELKEYEEKILGAEEKIMSLELELYQQLIAATEPFVACIQTNAQLIARLDCLLCFAHNAQRYNYHCPQLSEEPVIDIRNGRHPVIEQNLPPGESYVANDIRLDKDSQQIIILTGPNMSGKSALLRQTAIITLMAHMGSFVPADSAVIGLTDKIFTRVGASDNLSGGESTFMVEMNETASIINNISERSLVLLDEIGRGTSTYDGISIAWSIVEYLHDSTARPKTLFATHYHEINELENQLPRVKNFHITHKETGNKVIFLRKMAPGGSRHSFGIQVARMAGMPPALLERADSILALLEEKHGGQQEAAQKVRKATQMPNYQLNIFDGLTDDLRRVQQVLDETDINTLTPVEALLKLNELKGIVKQYQ